MDLQNQMKKAVAQAAVDQIQNGMILGLGSGSTAALMIEALAIKIKSGEIKDVVGVTTSFQGEVLASELGIPLKSLSSVSEWLVIPLGGWFLGFKFGKCGTY